MATVIGYDQSVKLRCTCRSCSAIVEYVPNEVKSYVHRDYGGGADMIYYIFCPGCGEKINDVKRSAHG